MSSSGQTRLTPEVQRLHTVLKPQRRTRFCLMILTRINYSILLFHPKQLILSKLKKSNPSTNIMALGIKISYFCEKRIKIPTIFLVYGYLPEKWNIQCLLKKRILLRSFANLGTLKTSKMSHFPRNGTATSDKYTWALRAGPRAQVPTSGYAAGSYPIVFTRCDSISIRNFTL